MERRRGFEPPCDPVTFLLVRSEGGYRRVFVQASIDQPRGLEPRFPDSESGVLPA